METTNLLLNCSVLSTCVYYDLIKIRQLPSAVVASLNVANALAIFNHRNHNISHNHLLFTSSGIHYACIRSFLRSLLARKKLIHSVRVTRDFVGWVRLDIVEAVKFWFRRPQHNFGIEISVQDERRRTYATSEVIASVNCSGDGTCTAHCENRYRH